VIPESGLIAEEEGSIYVHFGGSMDRSNIYQIPEKEDDEIRFTEFT